MASLEQRIRARLASYDTDAADLLEYAAVADALRAVLDLHQPSDINHCTACGVDGNEDPIPWPCDTVRVLARPLGITTEEDHR